MENIKINSNEYPKPNMSIKQVVELMKSSKNETEWNDNCDKIKKAFDNNYPTFWYSAIIMSGIASNKGF